MARLLPPVLAVALILIVLIFVVAGLLPTFPISAACSTDACKEAREWLSFAVTVSVVIGGLYQY
jgi:hypothetical protein